MKKIIRVAALGGAVALALAACGSAPEDTDETAGTGETSAAAVDYKACMVSDAGGFDDPVVQPGRLRRPDAGRGRAAAIEFAEVAVRLRDRLHAEHRRPGLRGLRPDHRRRVRARGPDPGGRARPTRTSSSRSSTRRGQRLRRPSDARERQAAALRHGAGRVPRRLPRRRLRRPVDPAGTVAHLRWHAVSRPSRSSWTASARARSTTTRSRAPRSRSSARRPSPAASWPTTARRASPPAIIEEGVEVLLPVGGPIYQSAMDAIADSGRERRPDRRRRRLLRDRPVDAGPRPDLDPEEDGRLDVRGDQGRGCRRSSTPRRTSARWRTAASASPRCTTSRTRSTPALVAEVEALQEKIIGGEVEVESYLAK